MSEWKLTPTSSDSAPAEADRRAVALAEAREFEEFVRSRSGAGGTSLLRLEFEVVRSYVMWKLEGSPRT